MCDFTDTLMIRPKKLLISLALIGFNVDTGCVLFYNISYFLVIKREHAAKKNSVCNYFIYS